MQNLRNTFTLSLSSLLLRSPSTLSLYSSFMQTEIRLFLFLLARIARSSNTEHNMYTTCTHDTRRERTEKERNREKHSRRVRFLAEISNALYRVGSISKFFLSQASVRSNTFSACTAISLICELLRVAVVVTSGESRIESHEWRSHES